MPGSYSAIGGDDNARTQDIRLPNSSGKVDPRIARAERKPDVLGSLRESKKGWQMLRDRQATKKPTSRRSPGGKRY